MLLEFQISSFQLSLVVYQILQSSGWTIERTAVLSYLVTLCSQLFIFYWNAHEIIIESTELAQAVFENEWYTFDRNIQ
ncbi:odorant receptor Or2-like, partial [Anoplophora glabripennis]|uniref:odorant receptor Or2-like n=1 Tax=Anoplophora glabripennis TaxID=217634 RepID=UPI000C784763